jgi:PAS domain S-box-containing protein/putative nucleotidyltransferase with HDIG domain
MRQASTILIVDDETAGRETLEALLTGQDYQLVFASTGGEALAKAAERQPDLILLDVMMPGMDGFEVCRRLRTDPSLAEVPIILVTALDDRDSRLRGIEAGADDFVTKPFDRIELRTRVRTITRLNRYRGLLQERARFERVVERAPVGVLIVDAQRAIRLANPAMVQLLAADLASQLVGQSVLAFIAPEHVDHCATLFDGVFANLMHVTRVEAVFVRPDGGRVPVELDVGQFVWDDQPAVQMIVRDITERRQAEAHIKRQLDRLAALRTIDLAITTSRDLRTTLNVVLDRVTTQLGVDAADVLLLQADTQTLAYAAGRGFHTAALQQTHLHLGAGYAGRAALERRTVTIPNIAETADFRRAPLLASEGFITYYGVPLIAKERVQGVLEVLHRTPLAPDSEWLDFLETLAGQAAIAIDNATLFDDLQHSNVELTLAYDTTIAGWSRALDLRDKETEGHSQRVTEMTLHLARAMGMHVAELAHVRRGALLHDIGKMGIPDAILLKPGPLTDEEWTIMRQHPVYAYELLAPIAYLQPALAIPYCHHEKWDGSGYPRGLRGEEIPLSARIFAVVDVWDAMRSDRPYRAGRPDKQVHAHIQSLAGSHFDPQVVQAFLDLERSPAD